MNIGFMRDLRLTSAKETFMLDCKAADLSSRTMRGYRDVLTTFIRFTGDITVKELKPDHVRMYIATLSDERFGGCALARHYGVVRTWIRWLYAQKMITERTAEHVKPPRFQGGLTCVLLTFVGDTYLNHLELSSIS